MSVFLEDHVRKLITAWETAELPEVARLVVELKESIAEADESRNDNRHVISAAEYKFVQGTNDVEIDDGALLSFGSEGVWVQAWLYVSNTEIGL